MLQSNISFFNGNLLKKWEYVLLISALNNSEIKCLSKINKG